MARLLVKAVDYVNADPEIDRKASWKRGDVVAIMPDSHIWGSLEGPPKFVRIDLPGEVSEYQHLLFAPSEPPSKRVSAAALKIPSIARQLNKVKPPEKAMRRRFAIDPNTLQTTDKAR